MIMSNRELTIYTYQEIARGHQDGAVRKVEGAHLSKVNELALSLFSQRMVVNLLFRGHLLENWEAATMHSDAIEAMFGFMTEGGCA